MPNENAPQSKTVLEQRREEVEKKYYEKLEEQKRLNIEVNQLFSQLEDLIRQLSESKKS